MMSPEEIAKNQDFDVKDILSGAYFVIELTKQDSKNHAGESYAVESLIELPGRDGMYMLDSSGAVVSETAVVSESTLAGRVEVHGKSHITQSQLSKGVVVESKSSVWGTHMAPYVHMGRNGHSSPGTRIGKGSIIGQYV